jgi:integrase
MKAGREHRVPLSAAGLRIVAEAAPRDGLLFPASRGRGATTGTAFHRLLDSLGYGALTVHGFRSTFRDWAAEETDFPNEVAEMALAHAVGNKVEAAYRRGDLFEKRRLLMEAWARWCGV